MESQIYPFVSIMIAKLLQVQLVTLPSRADRSNFYSEEYVCFSPTSQIFRGSNEKYVRDTKEGYPK